MSSSNSLRQKAKRIRNQADAIEARQQAKELKEAADQAERRANDLEAKSSDGGEEVAFVILFWAVILGGGFYIFG